ncbi:MAG: dTMP kinase [Victivallales bacterium]|nr:dTMP kinase [Victivallales bacterium]
MSEKKGLFITFEGGDCAGKTTQLRMLEAWLRERGRSVICTREPGGTSLAENIRGLLLSKGDGESMTPQAELLLFSAARAQHVKHVVMPQLLSGGVVLCDRFIDSTVAYQGFARGLDMDFIRRLNSFCTDGCLPDLTFLLDLPLAESRRRLASRAGGEEPDRMEDENNSFHAKVREGFLKIAEEAPGRVKVIDATRTVDEIHSDIIEVVANAID